MSIKISVIMSIYNTKEEYLREAIESILNQTFKEYEFIIINDCSNDNTTKILEEYQDKRIILIRNEQNYGLTASLNIGLKYAKGKYIARMDSDDISYVDRFEKQYRYMEKHLDVDILGGWARKEDKTLKSVWRAGNEWRRAYMLFTNVGIIHSTAFIRKSFLDKYKIKYDEKIKLAQDYDLWCRCLDCGTMAVLPKVLLMYRTSNNQISIKNKDEQDYYHDIIRKKELEKIYTGYTNKELMQFLDMDSEILSAEELDDFWQKIMDSNSEKKILNKRILKYKLYEEWLKIIVGMYKRKSRSGYISAKWLFRLASPGFWLAFIHNRLLNRI